MLKTLTTHHAEHVGVVVAAGVGLVQGDEVVLAAARLLRRPVAVAGETRATVLE